MVAIARPLSSSRYAAARWLVLAPHADDETLGAGALIAAAAASGRLAGVVFLTDGSGSHPAGGVRLARVRQREAGLALRRLTGQREGHPHFLGWPDATPHGSDTRAWRVAVRALATMIRTRSVDAIAVTAADEPHCDHKACNAVARAAIRAAHRQVALFDYVVWAAPPTTGARRCFHTEPMPTGRRRQALLAHRSQTSAALGPGFRLDRSAWRMPAHDILYLNGAPHGR